MLNASTTAIIESTGISASTLTSFVSSLFGQAISFMIGVFTYVLPYLLTIALIGIVVGLIYAGIRMVRKA